MSNRKRRISLAHLTVVDALPLGLIDAAKAGGFDSIGLRIVAPMPSDRIVPVVGDEAMIRSIEARLADTGIDILDVELDAARRIACRTSTGVDMFKAELNLQLDFFLAGET